MEKEYIVKPNPDWLYVEKYEIGEQKKGKLILARDYEKGRFAEFYKVLIVGDMVKDLYKVGDIIIVGMDLGHQVIDEEHKLIFANISGSEVIGKLEVKGETKDNKCKAMGKAE